MKQFERDTDTKSVRVSKKVAATVRAMSCNERAKLNRLLINVELLEDVSEAAENIGLSSNLFEKWMSTPELSWVINEALMKSKHQDKIKYVFVSFKSPEFLSSRDLAKHASLNLKGSKAKILRAAENNDKAFFIALGKCLSGDIDTTLLDRRDGAVLGLLNDYPEITAKDAVHELARCNFPRISEENFRMLKRRLKNKLHTRPDHNSAGDALAGVARYLNISAP